MPKKVIWIFGALLGLAGCIVLTLLVIETEGEKLMQDQFDSAAVQPNPTVTSSPARPVQPDIVTFWNNQMKKSEQSDLPEAAAAFRERIAAYTVGLPSINPSSPNWPLIQAPSVTMELFHRVPVTYEQAPTTSSLLAKHEPASGVYIGMLGADRRVGYDVTKIEEVYRRKHALYLVYVGWRKVQTDTNTYFPTRTADRVKELDGALQIGWEPRYGLDDVQDDEYVRRFAREAKASGIPIFLRYASEMNGAWMAWHGEPKKYIEKFRLIHDIMAEEAPNVAMVWSPNF